MHERWRWLVLALLWMAVIFWFSSQSNLPSVPEDWLDLLLKKGAHATAYGFLWYFWIRATHRPWLALVLTILYAISDEWRQTFVPGRHGRWTDVVIDTGGAVAALILTRFWLRRSTRLGER